jgi:hypothetical protein
MPVVAAASAPSALWYLTRGTGIVALVLLTGSVVLGVLTTSRWQTTGWPRFATVGLHRNVSLLVLAVLGIHIVAAEADTFAPVGWPAVLIPFSSPYRPIWLGLGTVAFDLFFAVILTSVLRARLGYRTWRGVHWLAYASWPVALVHGLGTGSDARLGWLEFLYVLSLAVVLAAVSWRVYGGRPSTSLTRLSVTALTALTVATIMGWALNGPLRAGWARRAGTPATLLANSGTVQPPAAGGTPALSAPAPGPAAGTSQTPPGLPTLPFAATLTGRLTQRGPDADGQVTIKMTMAFSGTTNGSVVVVLRGRADGAGVSLASSEVTFGPTADPTAYRGQVIQLDGDQLMAAVEDGRSSVRLGLSLQIDPGSGSIEGRMTAGT